MEDSSSWSCLPQGLLGANFNNLKDGCNSIPSLLISGDGSEYDAMVLCDITKQETKRLSLPEVRGHWICGCTNGWLLIISLAWPHEIHLLNPLSRTQILLPRISNFEYPQLQEYFSIVTIVEEFIKRAVISTTPLDPGCLVLVIFSVDRRLAYCRPEDPKWTYLDSQGHPFHDIMFYKGQFYAMNEYGDVLYCELNPNPRAIPLVSSFKREPGLKYLLESFFGDFLLVSRKLDWQDDGSLTKSFEVYKLDLDSKEWSQSDSLKEQNLFLGRLGSAMSSTGANCIYFIDDQGGKSGDGFTCLSVCDSETKLIKKLYQSRIWRSHFLWIKPAI